MALDGRYITSVDLSPYLVDKDTGAPLAGGVIEFWQDDSRSTPKPVYELTGSPPNYTYAALPNPVTLSATGTIADNNGGSCALYYFPFDSFEPTANIQLYYVVVKNSNGVVQFTREAWPNTTADTNPITSQNNTIVNMLSNPQFADVLFDPVNGLTLDYTGAGNTTTEIAPNWFLYAAYTENSSVVITRTSIAGITNDVTQPPYFLKIQPFGGKFTTLMLYQRLYHNPNIWAAIPGMVSGYIATNITLAPGTDVAPNALTMQYAPSGGATPTPLLSASNIGGLAFADSAVVQLMTGNNPDTADIAYTDIQIFASTSLVTSFSSVQVVGLAASDQNIIYEQTPVNRQLDQLFHYYNPLLQEKPINSYLIGWDFPLNPAQALTSTVAAFATGNSTSNYVWDQTIAFQTVNSGISFSRANTGALRVTAAADGQFALIQYLDQATAREVLNNSLSVNIAANASIAAGSLAGTATLWYTTNASLPLMSANTSVVSALDANGNPSVQTGWVKVSRALGTAKFSIGASANNNFIDYGFSGWDLNGSVDVTTATYFAIVIGFAPMVSADYVNFGSIALVPGNIPTRPAPLSAGQVLAQCQAFYEKSFNIATLPAQGIGLGNGELSFFQGRPGIAANEPTPTIGFSTTKRIIPVTITTYNPQTGQMNSNMWNNQSTQVVVINSFTNISQNGFQMRITTENPSQSGQALLVHWTADARLGF